MANVVSLAKTFPSMKSRSDQTLSIILILSELIDSIYSLFLLSESQSPNSTLNSSTMGNMDKIDSFIGK